MHRTLPTLKIDAFDKTEYSEAFLNLQQITMSISEVELFPLLLGLLEKASICRIVTGGIKRLQSIV